MLKTPKLLRQSETISDPSASKNKNILALRNINGYVDFLVMILQKYDIHPTPKAQMSFNIRNLQHL